MVAACYLSFLLSNTFSVLNDPNRFPIAVWLQSPSNASRYKAAGFNLYVGLWEGPKEEDLEALQAAKMPVICDQNSVGMFHLSDSIIVGWLQQDEPDNAQPITGGGYGPFIVPQTIIDRYKGMKRKDPSRPVLLNLGQGVANDEWIGRGNGASLDDYKTYVKGGDIVSFDIYPVAGYPKPNSEDYLYLVPKGIDRIRKWVDNKVPSWNCIECTSIDGGKKATPDQVKAEVWMSIIHGSTGLTYFVHQFKPTFKEGAILDDKPMLESVTRNHQIIQSLACVIHLGKTIADARAISSDPAAPIDIMAKQFGSSTYIFSVGMRNKATKATFAWGGRKAGRSVEVIGETRTIKTDANGFQDSFQPYSVHLYRIVN